MIFRQRLFFLFCIFFFIVFCVLGVWQLKRYHYKKTLIMNYQQQQLAAPVALNEKSLPSLQPFQRIFVEGEYRNDLTVLLQNQFYKDQLGFHVLTPFQIKNEKKLLLIDRGWIPREHAPLKKITGKQRVMGDVKWLSEKSFILGKNILDVYAYPLQIQKIDLKEISLVMNKSFYPFILRLDPKSPNGFAREWVITAMPAERHLGYAVQWFLMAFVLFIAAICFYRTREKK